MAFGTLLFSENPKKAPQKGDITLFGGRPLHQHLLTWNWVSFDVLKSVATKPRSKKSNVPLFSCSFVGACALAAQGGEAEGGQGQFHQRLADAHGDGDYRGDGAERGAQGDREDPLADA